MRAGLIGLPSTGKTTLFQLLTGSAIETERTSGRGEATIGVAHVPDDRLDRLTELFRPRKRVPATVTLADMATRTGPSAGGQALVNVAPYREADALLHVVRAFADERVAHPSGSIDPARDTHAIEDELILADLAVAESKVGSLADAIDADLASAKQQGVKIIQYHGWNDQVLQPEYSPGYYELVMAEMGGLTRTQDFYRLFMVPGMAHCYRGRGANSFGGVGQQIAPTRDAVHVK